MQSQCDWLPGSLSRRNRELQDGPDERQSGGLAGELADHLGAGGADLHERPPEEICGPDPLAVL